jgi:hypothetical protein
VRDVAFSILSAPVRFANVAEGCAGRARSILLIYTGDGV